MLLQVLLIALSISMLAQGAPMASQEISVEYSQEAFQNLHQRNSKNVFAIMNDAFQEVLHENAVLFKENTTTDEKTIVTRLENFFDSMLAVLTTPMRTSIKTISNLG